MSKKNAKTLKEILEKTLEKTPANSPLKNCAGKSSSMQSPANF